MLDGGNGSVTTTLAKAERGFHYRNQSPCGGVKGGRFSPVIMYEAEQLCLAPITE
jgi:hypothetical protein